MHGEIPYAKSKTKPIKVKVAKSFDQKLPKLAVFLFGANHTLANLFMFPPSTLLLPEDFKSSITFDVSYKNMPSGNFPKKFKFKHMLPNVFRLLRSKFQINEEEFLHSFKEEPIAIPCKNSNAFESFDHSFVFKIVENEYVEGLLNLMPSYFRYLSEKKFTTLLPQYCAIFKITVDNKKTCVVVMKNIMSGSMSNYDFYEMNCSLEKDTSKDIENSDDKKRKKPPPPSPELETAPANAFNFKFDSPAKTKACILEKAASDANFLCENNVHGWSFLVCKTNDESSPKPNNIHTGSLSNQRDKRFSYGVEAQFQLQDFHNYPITSTDDTFLDQSKSKISCYYVNTNDLAHHYYFGCMDISVHCKHVKKTFQDKIKKKQQPSPSTPTHKTKAGESEQPTTPNNHHKSKGRQADAKKLVQAIEVVFDQSELPNAENQPPIGRKSLNSSSDPV